MDKVIWAMTWVQYGLSYWKDSAPILTFGLVTIAAISAIRTYSSNARLERAKWSAKFYEKFFEANENSPYAKIRRILDCEGETDEIRQLVKNEDENFTIYLNFFEHLAFLEHEGQLSERDVKVLFNFYLKCLKRQPSVMEYISNDGNDFGELKKLLSKPI